MMKLAIVFIIVFSAQAFARGYGQDNISLKLEKVQLKKVLKAIEEQGFFRFVYKDEILPKEKRISIQVINASLDEVMAKVLQNTSLAYRRLSNSLIVISNQTTGSAVDDPVAIRVTGKVIDSKGEALSGVSVFEKGTNNGTTTSENGTFALEVTSEKSILVFSYVGYRSLEMPVNTTRQFNITLQTESMQMNEVVVIGYGTRQRKDVTGAISSVTSKDIEKSTSMTPELALQGKAAGVFVASGGGDPQARPIIRIRGVNTFGFAEPLYVVDGVPIYEGGAGVTSGAIGDIRSPINIFSMINPQDIESISILKDASAAAIYGVRASNGVVLITTKKGKAGHPKVEVAASYGIQNIPKIIDVLSTQQYFALVKEAYNNNPDAGVSFEQKFGPLYDASSPNYAGNRPTIDWQKALLNKSAAMQDYSVRLSGGNEGTTYYLSGGFAKTESPLKANSLQRYSIATNVDSRISKYLQAGLTVRLIQENSFLNTNADLPTMMTTIPFQPIYDPNDPTGFAPAASGTFVPNASYDPNLLNPGAPFVFAPGDPKLLWGTQTRFNPFAWQVMNSNNYDLVRALGNAYVQIEPIPGLKLKGSLGGDYFTNLRKQWTAFDSWRFSQTPGNPYAGTDGKSEGAYGEREGKTYNLNKELTLNYSHTFYTDHSIDIVLGASDQFARWSVRDLSGQVNYSDPQFRGISNQPPFTSGFSNILWEDDLIGYLGRISYKYKDRYYIDGTLRHDGSSRLAPGHKWDNFPSFAGAWRISSEKFFPKTKFINDLKIRGGWGKLGNVQSAGFYKFLSGISLTPDYSLGSGGGNPFGTQLQGAVLPNFANTTLTWEKLKTTNIGFDALLLNNSLSVTAEYYNKITSGIIQSVSLPPNTGIESPADLNVAKVLNRGIELQLGYNHKLGPVDFNVQGNITTVKNKVLKLYSGNPIGGEGGRVEEGYSLFYLWGYKVGGIFQTQAEIDAWRASHADVSIGQSPTDPTAGYRYKPGDMYFQDIYGNPRNPKERFSPNPDSIVNSNDRTYLGKTIPGYYYGLAFGATYKGIDINVFFQGVGDVQKYNYLRATGEGMGSLGNQWTTTFDRWTSGNASSKIPRAVYNNPSNPTRTSDRFVENAGYLRLKNLQIGYSIPQSLLNKAGFIKNFRIYGSAINLFTITDWTGYDPETDGVPTTRQFLIGINASF
jgi:TonB-linked SusC/RagA family outer membrane protein